MRQIVIGTAGHIDHGKTALIRALTGRDTDTLKEERERGISIDLGFTYFDFPDGQRAGIVDVPGHEKFLPNMLSGVCGMDLVLLVVALDEGIKPQTREHMEILEQLGVTRGILVLTKADCVETEWADLMEEEILEELGERVFADWPRLRVSAVNGDGIDELKNQIARIAAENRHERNPDRPFRMPVDRVITLTGRGTVITGTILEGRIRGGDTVELYPIERPVRVREIQSHGTPVPQAEAGQRAALLVTGVKRGEIGRGVTAAAPESLRNTVCLDVKIVLAADTGRLLKNRMRLHLHIGTGQVLCRAVLFGCEELEAGESGYAQLLLEEPLAVRKGDRFILRFYSPLETIGGGVVLDACGKKRKRSDPRALDRMIRLETGQEDRILEEMIAMSQKQPVSWEELLQLSGMEKTELEETVRNSASGRVVLLPGERHPFFIGKERLDELIHVCREKMGQYHRSHPYRSGMTQQEWKAMLFSAWERAKADAMGAYLENSRVVCCENGYYRLPDFHIIRDEVFIQTKENLCGSMSEARYQLLDCREFCPSALAEDQYRDLLSLLEEQKQIVQIAGAYYTTWTLAEEAVAMVRRYLQDNEVISYALLREMLGTSRKMAKLMMEYLDRRQITEVCGNVTERRAKEIFESEGKRCGH